MSVPLKPWEYSTIATTGASQTPIGPPTHYIPNTGPGRLQSSATPFPQSAGGGGSTMTSSAPTAPPLPPRPGNTAATRPIYSVSRPGIGTYGYGVGGMMMNSGYNYSPYTSNYGSYGGGGYGYGATGGYGAYRPSYSYGGGPYSGGYGPGAGEPTFSELAEESSASAFQSIESFVGAFGSISAMLESTFHAVYSSFRAVVGVADHLGRVKEILKTFAIFKFFRWMIRRILYLIGISKIKPEQIENLWNSISLEEEQGLGVASSISNTQELFAPRSKPSSWPIVMFLGFIFAGPYLMWKLIRSLNLNRGGSRDTKWASGEADHFLATPEYDFDPSSDRELRMRKGQTIRLAPAAQQPPNVQGWILASDGVKIGLVPLTYIKVLGKRSGNPVPLKVQDYTNMNLNLSLNPNSSPSPILPDRDREPSISLSRSSSQSTLKAGEN